MDCVANKGRGLYEDRGHGLDIESRLLRAGPVVGRIICFEIGILMILAARFQEIAGGAVRHLEPSDGLVVETASLGLTPIYIIR